MKLEQCLEWTESRCGLTEMWSWSFSFLGL